MKATLLRANWETNTADLRVPWSDICREVKDIGANIELAIVSQTPPSQLFIALKSKGESQRADKIDGIDKIDWTCPDCGETMPANCLGAGPGVHHTCPDKEGG